MSFMRDADQIRLDSLHVSYRLDSADALAITAVQTLSYAEDTGNTAIALGNGVFTQISSVSFAVPPTTKDVMLSWGGTLTVTAAGNGSITVAPCDVTSGAAPSAFASFGGQLVGGFLVGTFSAQPTFGGMINVGPSATWRVYKLYGFVGRDASSTLAASVRASGSNPANLKTWMRATVG